MQTRSIAILIMLSGFGFVFFAVEFAGVDLLMDPVGFVLCFNAALALRRWQRGFSPAAWFCLALAALSAAQMFAAGAALAAVRGVASAALYALLARGFCALLGACGRPRAGRVFAAAWGASAACSAADAVFAFAGPPAVWPAAMLALHAALLAGLLCAAAVPPRRA